ncbi:MULTISPECIES: hypothetical protein [unclassified Sphingobacterium]|uniref:hypothetical protein n=1 Tax=unclassified Sphingobacterium TaxID=2609468 RepID=UPI0025F6B522|nr:MULTISPECIES: hypothetical protein [unclassified Sphingobacterium]
MEVNSNNFLRWNSDPSFKDHSYLPCPYPNEQSNLPYMPVLVPGEITSFYINVKGGINYSGGFTLNIIRPDRTIALSDIGVLNRDNLGSGRYNLYCDMSGPAVPPGIYYLQIKDIANTVTLRSNMVRVIHSGFQDKTTIVRYRNNGKNLFHINWLGMPDFYQQYRLHIFRIDQQPDYNIEQYRSSTSGKLRNLNGSMDRYVKFQSYYFDKEAHEACEAMLFHSEIWINDKLYSYKTGYASEPLLATKKSKGEFELWDENFSSLNNC